MNYRHLDDEEREQIAHMKPGGKSLRAMARKLGRSPSTISRELARNRYPTDESYKVLHAGSMARRRRRRARQGSRFEEIHWLEVTVLLRQDYSPEKVSGWLGMHGTFSISHETSLSVFVPKSDRKMVFNEISESVGCKDHGISDRHSLF